MMPGPASLVLISILPGIAIGVLCGMHFGTHRGPRWVGLKWALAFLLPACLLLMILFSAIGGRGWVAWGQVLTGTLLFAAVNAIPATIAYLVAFAKTSPPAPKRYEE